MREFKDGFNTVAKQGKNLRQTSEVFKTSEVYPLSTLNSP
jgi:hypothetical protein